MYSTNQFRKNLKIQIDGVPYSMVEFQHVSPGKGSAFTRTRLKNLMTGNITERTFKSVEKVEPANVESREMQFVYRDTTGFTFMDNTSYEQVILSEDLLGEDVNYLTENLPVNVLFYNEKPIAVDLPYFIESEVVEADPAIKGDTVSGAMKVAKVKTGLKVNVPLHIKEGDVIKIDTRTGAYSEKVSK
jgi:elongation factor P